MRLHRAFMGAMIETYWQLPAGVAANWYQSWDAEVAQLGLRAGRWQKSSRKCSGQCLAAAAAFGKQPLQKPAI